MPQQCLFSVLPSFQDFASIFLLGLLLQIEQGYLSSHSVPSFHFTFFPLFLTARGCSTSLWEVRPLTYKWHGVERCALFPATCQETYLAKFHFNVTYFGIIHLRFLWNFLNYSFIEMRQGINHQ